jgi:hypothetical protein
MKQHLSTLSILHYVYGALVCLSGFAALFFLGLGVFLSSDIVAQNANEPPPTWLGGMFQALGLVLFIVIEIWGIFIILSGYWIAKLRNRTASIVAAALCLLSFPFGTALGVFTLVVLTNDEVKAEYEQGKVLA